MGFSPSDVGSPSRLRLPLDHFSLIEDTREPHRVAFPMAELLRLADPSARARAVRSRRSPSNAKRAAAVARLC